jgi:hypothetical protein
MNSTSGIYFYSIYKGRTSKTKLEGQLNVFEISKISLCPQYKISLQRQKWKWANLKDFFPLIWNVYLNYEWFISLNNFLLKFVFNLKKWCFMPRTGGLCYCGVWDQKDRDSRPVQANSSWDPISKIATAKWTADVAEVI